MIAILTEILSLIDDLLNLLILIDYNQLNYYKNDS